MSCFNPYGACPDAGYPTPSCGCGCNGGDAGFVPGGPTGFPGFPGNGYGGGSRPDLSSGPFFPPVPMTASTSGGGDVVRAIANAVATAGQALGFDVDGQQLAAAAGGALGKSCTGWHIDPQNATQEINVCCTPQVGRRGGRFQVAACLKVARQYDPWAGRRPGSNGGASVG